VHRVKNLFERVCSMRNLRLAAKAALRGKGTRPLGRCPIWCYRPPGAAHRQHEIAFNSRTKR